MALRVLVDATVVPVDRGALGRYVDGLMCALAGAGADLIVACQRADEERYGRLLPSAQVIAGPTAIAHRSARMLWEQSGLPLIAQQTRADVIHSPYYSMPLRPGIPAVVTIHDLTFFTAPDTHIREFCNLGYATACSHLPRFRDWDAIRFSVARTGGEQVTICFVCELAHAPIEHGELIFDLTGETWLKTHTDPRVLRLASCYLQTYRARQNAALI